MTVDGKVSTNASTPSGFTSRYDKHRLLEIRALGDAVLVGRNTLQTDNMSMGLPDQTLREARVARGQKEYPLRVVVSRSGNFPADLKIFKTHDSPIIIYSTNLIKNREALAELAALHLFGEEDLDLGAVLAHLYESYQVRTLVCEGGPTLAKALAQADALDQLFLTVAPRLFGGGAAPGILGGPGDYLPASRNYRMLSMEIIGNECYLHYASDGSPCIK